MWHVVARTVRGRLLFRSWAEGLEVWAVVVRAVPEPEAICLMPDHVHVVAPVDVRARLGRALGGLARKRNAREGRAGRLLERLPPAVEVPGTRQKVQRVLRYVHMNPVRAGLVTDPLAWPLSTHRDALGLTWPTVGPRRRSDFHAYVARDEQCPTGSELPGGALSASLPEVVAAVSAVLRVPVGRLGRHPVGRSLVWEACGILAPTSARAMARELGVGLATMGRRVAVEREALRRVERVVRDERFGALDDGPLLWTPSWGRYRRVGQAEGLPSLGRDVFSRA